MGKLVFYYGPMGCSKTANALMTRFQYLQKNRSVWLIKPAIDTSDNLINEQGEIIKALVKSRIGIEAEAEVIDSSIELFAEYINRSCKDISYNVIICDEAQFLTEQQVEQLKDIATYSDTDVLCYGLRTDFKTKLFPGSRRLFELADKTSELESICDCGAPALINARVNPAGKVLTHGAQVEIGGDEKYKPLCWKCYKDAIIK
jgi:thymidine kinase